MPISKQEADRIIRECMPDFPWKPIPLISKEQAALAFIRRTYPDRLFLFQEIVDAFAARHVWLALGLTSTMHNLRSCGCLTRVQKEGLRSWFCITPLGTKYMDRYVDASAFL